MTNKEILYLEAKERYYAGDPIMEDWEFDLLEDELKNSNSSVIKIVGSKKRGEYEHLSPMLSLGKINVLNSSNMDKQIDEFLKWAMKCEKVGNNHYEASGKFDGNSLNLIYKNGNLVNALTRSTGLTGFEHKNKASVFVPTTIPIKTTVEIRGEVILEESIFQSKYLGEYKNARNFVAGIMNSDELNVGIVKNFTFAAYDLRIYDQGADFRFPIKKKTLDILTALGFNNKFPIYTIEFNNLKDFKSVYDKFEYYRENVSPFKLDGMVIKADEKYRLELGFNSHDPEWAIAIKFPPKGAKTIIKDIDWQTGTTGEVVPTSVLFPVDLDGSEVKRATVFNKSKLFEMQAWPGAEVLVAKAGDIIPQIYKVIKPSTNVMNLPTHCPSCNSILEEDEKHLWCRNEDCPAQVLKKIDAGVKIFKFKGIGISIVEKLFNAGIECIEDYFNKKKFNEQALIMNGDFVRGQALKNILDSVNSKRSVTLEQVIRSMKIKDVGESVSNVISKYFGKIPYSIKGVNKEAFKKMTDKNSPEYHRLMNFLIVLKNNLIDVEFPSEQNNILIPIEFTGTPPRVGDLIYKSDWFMYLKKYGYVKGKLNADCKFLLTESMESTSGKMKKAESLKKKGSDIQIIDYIGFIRDIISDPDKILEVSKITREYTSKNKSSQKKTDDLSNKLINQTSLF